MTTPKHQLRVNSSVKALLLVAGFCAGCASSHAAGQVIAWGSTDGLWNVPANWQGLNTPNTQAETALIDAPGSYIVTHPAIPTSIFGLNVLNSSAQLHFVAGSSLRVGTGGIINNATILLNNSALPLATSLTVLNSTTLSGSGQLVLNASASNVESSIITASGNSVTLTQDAAHTIHGSGTIYSTIVNNGTIASDIPGQSLRLTSQPKGNNGLLTARNGSVLSIECPISQSGAGTILADNSEVTLSSSVSGGLIRATGPDGRISLVDNADLFFLSFSGLVNVVGGNIFLSDLITNNGLITVNSRSIETPTTLNLRTNVSFEGTGQLLLNAPATHSHSAKIRDLGDRYVLFNGTDHTIKGSGIIDTGIQNRGSIVASSSNRSLSLLGEPIVNLGVIRALPGATLHATGTITQGLPVGTLHAAGGVISLSNAYITDGSLLSTDGGVLRFLDYSTIFGTLNNADIRIQPNSTLVLWNTVESNGSILINETPTDGPSTLTIRFNINLNGTGRLILNASPSNLNAALIDSLADSYILTLSPAQSLEGSGRIFARTICQGTLSPGLESQPIGHLSFGDSGRLTLSPTSTLNIQIGGLDSTQSDLISSAIEPIYLYGTLNISSLTGLTPAPGQTWTIMTGPSFIGTFANIQFPTLSPSGGLRINYLPTSIQLEYFCYADANEDGGIDGSDIQAFFALWELSDPAADLTNDGGVDGADLELFFTSWESGNC